MTYRALTLRAGRVARRHLLRYGLRPEDVAVIPGAAGGPKALGLQGLDRALFGELLPRAPRPRALVGASIGAWRFAAAALPDPVAGIERLGALYPAQRFPPGISASEVSRRSAQMLSDLLDGQGEAILRNPHYRLSVVVNRSRGLLASDRRLPLMLGLSGAIARNLVRRRWLSHHLRRVIVHDPRAAPPVGEGSELPTERAPLTPRNLRAVLLASGSIPVVMEAVRQVPGLPAGAYRDGGVTDYHLDLPWATDDLVLYPHFGERIVPGWFDKRLWWRRPDPERLARVVLVAPSAEYLARLPHGRLPDRRDFERFAGDDAGREACWRRAMDESRRLGDELLERVERGRWDEVIRPL